MFAEWDYLFLEGLRRCELHDAQSCLLSFIFASIFYNKVTVTQAVFWSLLDLLDVPPLVCGVNYV